MTEIISGDKVNALVKGVKEEVKEVERRAESDVSNLVKELSKEVSGLGATVAGAIKVSRGGPCWPGWSRSESARQLVR